MKQVIVVVFGTLGLLASTTLSGGGLLAADNKSADTGQRDDPARSPIEAGELEILTRGPIHEAFAALPVEQLAAPMLVRQGPPRPLGEQVPQIKPAGNVQWIPGYWQWNDDADYWVWVTGAWRIPPPNRRWTPGYWSRGADGSRWVSGFWTAENSSGLSYMPAPRPEPKREEVKARAGEFIIPGHWLPQDDTFVWQPAKTAQFKAGHIWMPAQHYWTPAGFVFVDGYWDYAFSQRGWLYTPLGLTDSTADPSQFKFSADMLLNLTNVSLDLLVRPAQRTYYFGHFNGAGDLRHGFQPAARYAALHDEPIFGYLDWFYGRQNPNWLRDAQASLRSGTTNNEASSSAGGQANTSSQTRQMLISANEFSSLPAVRSRISRLGAAQLAEVKQKVDELRLTVRERRKTELDRSSADGPAAVSARDALARSGRLAPRGGHSGGAADEIAGSMGAQPGSMNFRPRSIGGRSGFDRDDFSIDRLGSADDLTADSAAGTGLRMQFSPSLYGTAAISGRSYLGTGGVSGGMSSRALIYNGLPGGGGNTLGGVGAASGGVPSLPSGIGSGYQGGSPAGGINAPGGSYGLGSPAGPGGGNFYGAGGGGTGHGTPGGGS